MPFSTPPSNPFQGPLVPLRGLWNAPPKEGDRFVSCEIDWGSIISGNGVAFQLSGNSPVSISQIVALFVDNTRCGAPVQFWYPDTGFLLTVPAHNQGLFPVLTNALTFYAIGTSAGATDTTIVQICNSIPPVIALNPTDFQNIDAVSGISLTANTSTPITPNTINGTLNAISISGIATAGGGGSVASIFIQDGLGNNLWQAFIDVVASTTQQINFSISGLDVRFRNGLNFVVSGSTMAGGAVVVNAYYTTP